MVSIKIIIQIKIIAYGNYNSDVICVFKTHLLKCVLVAVCACKQFKQETSRETLIEDRAEQRGRKRTQSPSKVHLLHQNILEHERSVLYTLGSNL